MLELFGVIAALFLTALGVARRDTSWGKAALVLGLVGGVAVLASDAPTEFAEGFRDGFNDVQTSDAP